MRAAIDICCCFDSIFILIIMNKIESITEKCAETFVVVSAHFHSNNYKYNCGNNRKNSKNIFFLFSFYTQLLDLKIITSLESATYIFSVYCQNVIGSNRNRTTNYQSDLTITAHATIDSTYSSRVTLLTDDESRIRVKSVNRFT